MKAKLVGAGIAAALAVVGIGTAVAGAAAPTQSATPQRSTVIDRSGRGFIQDDQGQTPGNCPERNGTTPQASPSPSGTTSSDV